MRNLPVRLYMDGDTLTLRFRVYLDISGVDAQLAREMIFSGIARPELNSPYKVGSREVAVRVIVEEAPAFSLDAVNVRVYDITPVVRRRLSPKYNVSRAYFGADRRTPYKLWRRALRFPDVFINVAGRSIDTPRGMELMQSVVMHEFMHVVNFQDKYRGKKGKKRNKRVQDRDIMYRTGAPQHMMEYHVKRLLDCAVKGKLPIRRI